MDHTQITTAITIKKLYFTNHNHSNFGTIPCSLTVKLRKVTSNIILRQWQHGVDCSLVPDRKHTQNAGKVQTS